MDIINYREARVYLMCDDTLTSNETDFTIEGDIDDDTLYYVRLQI